MSSTRRAFISHSGPDDRYVAEFVQLVRSLGYDEVFNDSHTIEPDKKFWERIEQGIRECDAFVVILSRSSVRSNWVDREVQFARTQGKRIIPIRIDDCALPPSFDGRDVIELKHAGKSQRLSPPRFIHHAAENFLGREPELALLDTAWANGTNVLSLIAWGGVGKTALITEWVSTRFIDKQWKTEDGQPALMAYFDWSFYDQGTCTLADGSSTRTGSVGDFFEQALTFFGDLDPNVFGKGRRLADLIRQQRSLVILDGLEPLQLPPGHPQAGRLLDPDLRDLFTALAQSNPGLCLITSRQSLTDLHGLRRTVAKEYEIEDLPKAVAIRLLRQLQIKGTDQELAEASEKFGCHALSLTLLGRYLFDAHDGDIRRSEHIALKTANELTLDEKRQRNAWKVLETYEAWLAKAREDGNPKILSVLRLTGLFDRPATAGCLAALRAEPIIPGLTDTLCGIDDDEWNILLKRLERAHLISLSVSSNSTPAVSGFARSMDAHPLVREYFAERLKQTEPEAFKAAHSRVFEYLCAAAKYRPDRMDELAPLYQAVSHGCAALRHQEAKDKVYLDRILRGTGTYGFYSTFVLGALSQNLAAVSSFFALPWDQLHPNITVADGRWLLGEAAFALAGLGRIAEALQAREKSYEILANNQCRCPKCCASLVVDYEAILLLKDHLGLIEDALGRTEKGLGFSDQCGIPFRRIALRANWGNRLHLYGRRQEALLLFEEAEREQAATHSHCYVLTGLIGFKYCDLLLASFEQASWRFVMRAGVDVLYNGKAACTAEIARSTKEGVQSERHILNICSEVTGRAKTSLYFVEMEGWLHETALDRLTLARLATYSLLTRLTDKNHEISEMMSQAVAGLRNAQRFDDLPLALLTGSLYQGTLGNNLEEAERLLEEAQQIAECGPMPLYLADVHLHRARLFGRLPAEERREKFSDIDPKAELAEARRLIEKHGYWRRKEELEDAEAAAVGW